MRLDDWLKDNSTPGDLCAPPMSADDAASVLITELLDDDFQVGYPGNAGQILAEVVCALVNRYGRRK